MYSQERASWRLLLTRGLRLSLRTSSKDFIYCIMVGKRGGGRRGKKVLYLLLIPLKRKHSLLFRLQMPATDPHLLQDNDSNLEAHPLLQESSALSLELLWGRR